jgi:two-component system, NtrC family, response regulator AtoC
VHSSPFRRIASVAGERETEARIRIAPPSEIGRRLKYALLVVNGKTSTAQVALPDEGETTIGRSDECTLKLPDSLLSRMHAVVRRAGAGFEVVDCGSMNGTFLGSERLEPGVPRAFSVGDVLHLGATDLVLQFASGGARPRRLWTHGYFEARVEDECARAADGGHAFAIVHVKVDRKAVLPIVETTIAELLRPIDVVATFAAHEYEVLLVETTAAMAAATAREIVERLERVHTRADVAVASYPLDGRTPEALLARAGQNAGAGPDTERVVRNGALAHLERLVDKLAGSTISVLVLGETGVGKEVLARMIHERSPRAKEPFVCLNCASLSESLLESEMFGHEKGAFTGAVAAKAGLLESAEGGTVFLDEVGEMPLSLQAKLLRVLEQREVLRVGALRPRAIDVRFLSATNRDLEQEIARQRFRGDLYYRLNGFSVVIPPLRERVDEIEPLARHFVRNACRQSRTPELDIAPDALALLTSYEWPGNIRELKNTIDRAVLLSGGRTIAPEHLPQEKMARLIESRPSGGWAPFAAVEDVEATVAFPGTGNRTIPSPGPTTPSLYGEDDAKKRKQIVDALEKCAGNQTAAAKMLGIARQTLVTRLEQYNLPRPRKREGQDRRK